MMKNVLVVGWCFGYLWTQGSNEADTPWMQSLPNHKELEPNMKKMYKPTFTMNFQKQVNKFLLLLDFF